MRPFIGNPCMRGNCMRTDCEQCPAWTPVIYIGKKYKIIKLPKWNWLVNSLYRIEHWLLER